MSGWLDRLRSLCRIRLARRTAGCRLSATSTSYRWALEEMPASRRHLGSWTECAAERSRVPVAETRWGTHISDTIGHVVTPRDCSPDKQVTRPLLPAARRELATVLAVAAFCPLVCSADSPTYESFLASPGWWLWIDGFETLYCLSGVGPLVEERGSSPCNGDTFLPSRQTNHPHEWPRYSADSQTRSACDYQVNEAANNQNRQDL